MRIDDQTIERLIEKIEHFNDKLTNYESFYDQKQRLQSENSVLTTKVRELETKLKAPEYLASTTRADQLNKLDSTLKAALKLEYDKGYAAAYTEVTSKMRQS